MGFCKPTNTLNVINDIFLKGRIVKTEYDSPETLALILQSFQEQGFVLGCVSLKGELMGGRVSMDMRKISYFNVLKIPTIHHKDPTLRQQIKQVLSDLYEGKVVQFENYQLRRQRLVDLITNERKFFLSQDVYTIIAIRDKGRIVGYQKSIIERKKRA